MDTPRWCGWKIFGSNTGTRITSRSRHGRPETLHSDVGNPLLPKRYWKIPVSWGKALRRAKRSQRFIAPPANFLETLYGHALSKVECGRLLTGVKDRS